MSTNNEKDNRSESRNSGNNDGGKPESQAGSSSRSQDGRESKDTNTGTKPGNPGNFTTDREHATDAGKKREEASHGGRERAADKKRGDQDGDID